MDRKASKPPGYRPVHASSSPLPVPDPTPSTLGAVQEFCQLVGRVDVDKSRPRNLDHYRRNHGKGGPETALSAIEHAANRTVSVSRPDDKRMLRLAVDGRDDSVMSTVAPELIAGRDQRPDYLRGQKGNIARNNKYVTRSSPPKNGGEAGQRTLSRPSIRNGYQSEIGPCSTSDGHNGVDARFADGVDDQRSH